MWHQGSGELMCLTGVFGVKNKDNMIENNEKNPYKPILCVGNACGTVS
jgi:hypothetical protein